MGTVPVVGMAVVVGLVDVLVTMLVGVTVVGVCVLVVVGRRDVPVGVDVLVVVVLLWFDVLVVVVSFQIGNCVDWYDSVLLPFTSPFCVTTEGVDVELSDSMSMCEL